MAKATIRYQRIAWGTFEEKTLEGEEVGYNPDYEGFARIWLNTDDQRHSFLVLKEHVISIEVIHKVK